MKKILLFLLLPIASFAQVQFGGPNDLFLTGASALTATVNNILPAGATSANGTDMSGYGAALVQVVSTGTGGTFIFEGSNDVTNNYQTIPVWNQAIATGTPITAAITATSSQIGYWVPKKFRYIRLRIATTITGGSIQAVSTFTRTDTDPNYFQVANATAANLQATVTATNLSTNIAQMNGVAVTMGAGATGTGVQRVILATDNLPTAAASADALANPTISQLGADQMTFNGTSWDRQRSVLSLSTTTGDTGAKTATGNGATQTNVGSKGIQLVLNMGTVTGTLPTFVLKIQGSVDGGTNFVDIPGATTASLTATGLYGITLYPGIATTAGVATTGTIATAPQVIPRTWRVVWTVGGTTPSFTITSITFHYTD